jgi:hypothetical protein
VAGFSRRLLLRRTVILAGVDADEQETFHRNMREGFDRPRMDDGKRELNNLWPAFTDGVPSLGPVFAQLQLLQSAQPHLPTLPTDSIRSSTDRPTKAPTSTTSGPPFDPARLDPVQRRKVAILKGKRERLERDLARLRGGE